MKKDENLNERPHWRCRLCGYSTPLEQAVCSNPNCRADLGIYGEAVTPGRGDTGRRAWRQWEEEARQQREYDQRQEEEARQRRAEEQRREEAQRQKEEAQQKKDEAQRQKAEEQRRRAEEKARAKADRQAGRSGGGAPKWLVPALAAVLVAALGIGAGVFFAGQGTAGNFTLPWGSGRPGQGGAPDSGAWKGNVLMADPNLGADNEADEYPAFGSAYPRENIASVTFMDSLDDMHGDSWDVSQAQDGSVMAWIEDARDLMYDLYIGAEGGVEAPADCSEMFDGYINVKSISFNGAFHTDHVTDMCAMFLNCESLREVDVSGFDTSGVTNMDTMFCGCTALKTVDVSGFDTTGVTSMNAMFAFCGNLQELDVSGFDTAGVTNLAWMFNSCKSLTKLNVSGFKTSGATSMGYMFGDCSSVTELDVSGFDTANVTNMAGMFGGCSRLRELDVTSFDTSNVTDMNHMFNNCSGLGSLDITNFKTSNVTDMSYMFFGVSKGFALNFAQENFDTSNVENYKCFMADSFDWKKMFE